MTKIDLQTLRRGDRVRHSRTKEWGTVATTDALQAGWTHVVRVSIQWRDGAREWFSVSNGNWLDCINRSPNNQGGA